jgi:undecaprenyl diphosphate synthase
MSYIEQIDKTRIPQHVAIIMDGNGRWAKQRGKERTYGHHAGAETVQKITEDAARLGLYTPSQPRTGIDHRKKCRL